MRQVIGYLRVSTEGQATDGVSLDLQAQKIAAYCALHGWPLGELIQDDGVSAKNLQRPGIQRVLAMVDAGAVEAVIVYKLDRLSRRTKDVLDLVERFERADVGFHSIQEHLDTKSAIGRFVLCTLASLAEMERDLISERTIDAMAHCKAHGKVYSRPRYLDQERIAWMLAQRQAGRSYHDIAAALNAAGVPTARGGRWQGNTVRQIVGRVA
jgi:DNA invertase Pin-like site-specific DNA recombinase